MSTHPTAEDLADAAAGVLTPEHGAEVDHHVASCPDCATAAHQLRIVRSVLADSTSTPMPIEVVQRLDATLLAESARRASGEADRDLAQRQAEHAKRLSLGSFGDNVPTKRHTGIPEVDGAFDRADTAL